MAVRSQNLGRLMNSRGSAVVLVTLALALIAAVIASGRWSVLISISTSGGSRFSLGFGSGTADLWWVPEEPGFNSGFEFHGEQHDDHSAVIRWPPFALSSRTWPHGLGSRGFSLPIWILPAPALAWSGYILGLRFGGRAFVRSLRSQRCCEGLSAILLVVVVGSAFGGLAVSFVTGALSKYRASVANGLLELWWEDPTFRDQLDDDTGTSLNPPNRGIGAEFWVPFYREVSLAWRPIHTARGSFPAASNYHGVSFPLWMSLVPAIVLAGHARGSRVRAQRANCCATCGYPRSGLDSVVNCPECGSASEPRPR